MRVLIAAVPLFFAGPVGPTFVTKSVPVAESPRRLGAADLDGDGDVDLIVLCGGPGVTPNLRALIDTGGTFVPGWTIVESGSYFPSVQDVDLADTDGDGDSDLIDVSMTTPRQRTNDGSAQFDAVGYVPTLSIRVEHQPADMDGDGDVDAVYYEEDIFNDAYVGLLEGAGNGTLKITAEEAFFWSPFNLSGRLAIGDVTGDGLPDAFLARTSGGLAFVQAKPLSSSQKLTGWLAPKPIYGTGCANAVLTDLNDDGLLDIVATVPSLDSVVAFLTRPGGKFGSARLFSAGPAPDAIVAADFDLDGAVDVMVSHPGTGNVSLLRGGGSGRLAFSQSFPAGAEPTDMVATDLDRDGDQDVAVTCGGSGEVALLYNAAH